MSSKRTLRVLDHTVVSLGLLTVLAFLAAPRDAWADLPSAEEVSALQSRIEQAHQALAAVKPRLTATEYDLLSAKLVDVEQAFQHFLTLSRKQEEKAAQSRTLVATGGVVFADDAAGGVADDFLLPFIGLGLLANHLSRSADSRPISAAWNLTLVQLYLLSATITEVAAQKRPGCACKCYKKGIGPDPGPRVATPNDCLKHCTTGENSYTGYQCGGAVIWIN